MKAASVGLLSLNWKASKPKAPKANTCNKVARAKVNGGLGTERPQIPGYPGYPPGDYLSETFAFLSEFL